MTLDQGLIFFSAINIGFGSYEGGMVGVADIGVGLVLLLIWGIRTIRA
jgi:hypothetical protein